MTLNAAKLLLEFGFFRGPAVGEAWNKGSHARRQRIQLVVRSAALPPCPSGRKKAASGTTADFFPLIVLPRPCYPFRSLNRSKRRV